MFIDKKELASDIEDIRKRWVLYSAEPKYMDDYFFFYNFYISFTNCGTMFKVNIEKNDSEEIIYKGLDIDKAISVYNMCVGGD